MQRVRGSERVRAPDALPTPLPPLTPSLPSMDDTPDPISQFFQDAESVDLYEVLSVSHDAKADEIKKAYRRLALAHHPDKHATASDSAKVDASLKFQQVGFAYAVLSDEKRRLRYDKTG